MEKRQLHLIIKMTFPTDFYFSLPVSFPVIQIHWYTVTSGLCLNCGDEKKIVFTTKTGEASHSAIQYCIYSAQ